MRGKKFTKDEQDAIRLLRAQDFTLRKIADLLNRGKSGIEGQIKRMEADGSFSQQVMDLGQFDEQE